jgi:hypothetical protein
MKVGNAGALLSAVLMCVSGGAPIACGGEVIAAPAPQASTPAMRSMDVVTNAAGELRGAVVNADTAPSVNAKVVLANVGSKESQESATDASGRFLFKNVRPGVYSLAVNGEKGQAQAIARVWAQETAPPAASPEARLALEDEFVESDVVTGRPGLGGRGLLGAALVAAGVSSAIAIPVSVSNANRGRTP